MKMRGSALIIKANVITKTTKGKKENISICGVVITTKEASSERVTRNGRYITIYHSICLDNNTVHNQKY